MEKEVIIALLGDISNDIKIDLLKSEDMLSNKENKDRIIGYLEASIKSVKRKIDKIK